MELNNYDLGWIVGFLEGEGSFQAKKIREGESRRHAAIVVVSTELESLNKIKNLIGGKLYGPYNSKHKTVLRNTKNPKQFWIWNIAKHKEAIDMMNYLKSHLSQR